MAKSVSIVCITICALRLAGPVFIVWVWWLWLLSGTRLFNVMLSLCLQPWYLNPVVWVICQQSPPVNTPHHLLRISLHSPACRAH